jgi:hypothetical protein
MHVHPLIHSELARQRQVDLRRDGQRHGSIDTPRTSPMYFSRLSSLFRTSVAVVSTRERRLKWRFGQPS